MTNNIPATLQEIVLLKFLLTKDNFTKYIQYISELNLEKETETILKAIQSYYEEFPDKNAIGVQDLILFNSLRNPITKRNELYSELFNKMDSLELNPTLIKENFNNILEQYFTSEIMFKISEAINEGTSGIMPVVQELVEGYNDVKQNLVDDGDKFVSNDIREIMKRKVEVPGILWRLPSLNNHLGEIRGKILGHIFARVDTGKTSFVLSEEAYWLTQLKEGECIIHFNNEEDGEKLMSRFYQAFLNISKDTLEKHPERAYEEFVKRGGHRFKLHDEAIITIEDIEEMCKLYNPKIVVIDQADKLQFHGDSKLGDVARLQRVYSKLRELTKKYDTHILTVGQASQSAENRKWLLPTDLDSSKTLKPGEFDYIIGIGKIFSDNFDPESDDVRYMHLCKNKLGTGQHAQFEAIIDTGKALYREPSYEALEEEDAYGKYKCGVEPQRLAYMRPQVANGAV